ncbi:MAG: hypothetical protein RIT28_3169 [Pseudomonadota bacterium]|jgi:hypothetical protein
MSRLLFAALLLTSCAAEVAPRAEPGDPRVLPVGAVAALDGSFSEGDGLSYAWTVEPALDATLTDSESPFATFTADAPGFYILSLEVCDAGGRCDIAETWARVDAPGSASKISDWGIDTFAGAESGVGLSLGVKDTKDDVCKACRAAAKGTTSQWNDFCRSLHELGVPDEDIEACWEIANQTSNKRGGWCSNEFC